MSIYSFARYFHINRRFCSNYHLIGIFLGILAYCCNRSAQTQIDAADNRATLGRDITRNKIMSVAKRAGRVPKGEYCWLSANEVLVLPENKSQKAYRLSLKTERRHALNRLTRLILASSPSDVDRGWIYNLSPDKKSLIWGEVPLVLRKYHYASLNGRHYFASNVNMYAHSVAACWSQDSRQWAEVVDDQNKGLTILVHQFEPHRDSKIACANWKNIGRAISCVIDAKNNMLAIVAQNNGLVSKCITVKKYLGKPSTPPKDRIIQLPQPSIIITARLSLSGDRVAWQLRSPDKNGLNVNSLWISNVNGAGMHLIASNIALKENDKSLLNDIPGHSKLKWINNSILGLEGNDSLYVIKIK